MDGQSQGGYFYAQESEQFTFLRVPKDLFANERYKGLSGDSILLYSLMLDRVGLSRQNNWIDSAGRVYVYFTIDEIMATFRYARATAVKMLSRLCEYGLAEKKRQGQGKPTALYLKKFIC
jgi:hypothetical protein